MLAIPSTINGLNNDRERVDPWYRIEFLTIALPEAAFADVIGTTGAALIDFGGQEGSGKLEYAVGDVAIG